MELSRRLIPYEIRSGVRFFEQAHIKDVLAYLKIVTNPRDELSWKRVLKLYPKVGEKTAAEVWGRIGRRAESAASVFLRGGRRQRHAARCRQPRHRCASVLRTPRRRIDAAQPVGVDPPRRRARLRRLRAREVPERPGAARRPRAALAVRAALRDVERVPRRGGAGESDRRRGRRGGRPRGREDRAVVACIRPRGWSGAIVFVIWLADGRFPSQRALRVPGGIVRVDPSARARGAAAARGSRGRRAGGRRRRARARSSFPARRRSGGSSTSPSPAPSRSSISSSR